MPQEKPRRAVAPPPQPPPTPSTALPAAWPANRGRGSLGWDIVGGAWEQRQGSGYVLGWERVGQTAGDIPGSRMSKTQVWKQELAGDRASSVEWLQKVFTRQGTEQPEQHTSLEGGKAQQSRLSVNSRVPTTLCGGLHHPRHGSALSPLAQSVIHSSDKHHRELRSWLCATFSACLSCSRPWV